VEERVELDGVVVEISEVVMKEDETGGDLSTIIDSRCQ